MTMQVTERTLGSLGMDWGSLLNSFGVPGSVGVRPSELHWERPKARTAPASPDVKRCEHCGELFERPSSLRPSCWSALRYCCRDCRDAAQVRVEPDRACKHCGAIIPQPGRPSAYRRRAYCSPACGNKARRVARPTCAAPGCDRLVHCHGLCGKHYMRHLRGGLKRPERAS